MTAPALSEVVARLRELVECESPSADDAALARSADRVAALGTALLGVAPERVPGPGRHLLWRFGDRPRVVLIGHHDTVWPIGSWARTWTEDGDRLSGPGCFDMKAGLVIALHAAARLADRDGLAILVNSDEEVGSPTSRELVARLAADAGTALVFEASAPGGALKTARRGNATYRIEVTGTAAHAGLEPERGVNAAVEASHQVLAVHALAGQVPGTSVVPSVLAAGTTSNTVPASGSFTVDVRYETVAGYEALDALIRGLEPVTAGAGLRVTPLTAGPPLERGSSAALYELVCQVAARESLPVPGEAAVGGASDGNTAAGAGARVLDGLGAVGHGAHAPGEWVDATQLVPRIRLVSALLAELLATPGSGR